jgi:UPF0755 protein
MGEDTRKEAKKRKKASPRVIIFLVVTLVILFVLVVVEIFPGMITKKKGGDIIIDESLSAKEIALFLKSENFIIDPYGFQIIASLSSKDTKLKSGRYKLQNINNVFNLIASLEKGGLPEEISVTIPEGFTVKEIAKRLSENKIISDEQGFIEYALPFEGFLFPDTYRFVKGEVFDSIVLKMRNRFQEILGDALESLPDNYGFSLEEVIILASIVEKEAKLDKDRPLVASVFLNRLSINMPLQADSTINYILHEHKEWLSKEDYEIDSPYNTYRYPGLPEGPISNPGRASVLAVLNAPESPYYYFMTKPDGEAIFAKTLTEHERNLAEYYGGH